MFSVKQLYEDTHIPKNKIYETLQNLKNQGIVGYQEGTPKLYFIMNDALLDARIQEKEGDLERLRERLQEIRSKREKINPSILSIIDGADEMHRLLEYSNLSIQKEILSCSRLRKMYYGCYRTLKDAVARGVKVKFVAPSDAQKKVLKAYHDIGVDIRIYHPPNGVFPKIGLLDERYTRITIARPDVTRPQDQKTIWANSSILYNIVKNHFDKIWADSKPFEP